jgi:hypothetical protein
MEMCDSEDCHHQLIHHSLSLSHGPQEGKLDVCLSHFGPTCSPKEDKLFISVMSRKWRRFVCCWFITIVLIKTLICFLCAEVPADVCVAVVSVVSSRPELWAQLFVCFVFWPQCCVLLGCYWLFFVTVCHWPYMSPYVNDHTCHHMSLTIHVTVCHWPYMLPYVTDHTRHHMSLTIHVTIYIWAKCHSSSNGCI